MNNNNFFFNYLFKKNIIKSKNFAIASKLFDIKSRNSISILYNWCRYCDDIIDHQNKNFSNKKLYLTFMKQQLSQLKLNTKKAYKGHYISNPVFIDFKKIIIAHKIPSSYVFDHLEGFSMDVHNQKYITLNDTLRYCYHIAGTVGKMIAKIIGIKKTSTLVRACDLGLAFQLTNITRDIIEDFKLGRCYIPEEWLKNENLNKENYTNIKNRKALSNIAKKLINTADLYYNSAMAGLSELSLRSALAIETAKQFYRAIGVKIYNLGDKAWNNKQHIKNIEKFLYFIVSCKKIIFSRAKKYPPRSTNLYQYPI